MLAASKSIQLFLESKRNSNNSDLLERILAHGTNLELQVNVGPCGGELVDGTTSTYTDGCDRWHSFRIPKGSYSEPHWQDYQLRYPLDKYVDAIGSTGWHWFSKTSLWVAFDIDSILGHAEGVGISDAELERVRTAVSALDYVEVRKSTGGAGLHLYVFVPPGITTANHGEHAAVARCILARMSEDVGFDLSTNVDVCGSNTWIWAKRANMENEGFRLIKAAKGNFPHDLSNWKSHIAVVSRARSRVSVGVEAKEEDFFTQLASSHERVPLDAEHLAIREALMGMKGTTIWVQDHHLLQTHTSLLANLKDHSDVPIRGVFKTNSAGTNLNQPNCFAFPMAGGAWRVFRFGSGTAEDRTWTQDGKSWTTCFFNRRPSLDTVATATGAKVLSKGGYEFSMLKDAREAIIRDLAGDDTLHIPIPEKMAHRKAIVKTGSKGRVVIEVPKMPEDPDMPEWNSVDKKNHWTFVVNTQSEPEGGIASDYDTIMRCLVTPSQNSAGWTIMTDYGYWTRKAPGAVKTVLQSIGHAKPEAECAMGCAEKKPWQLVTIPFAPEYPGGRQWNLDAPQLALLPAPPNDAQETQHPHWDMMFDHIGGCLNKKLRTESWAQDAGIITGRQYLQAWYANVIRHPFAPLPYLFLHGPQNSGKSIFHEAFSILVTGGVAKADAALTSAFNGELEGCVLAVVEEKDVAKAQGAHDKIKEAVTAEFLAIRRMRTDIYQVRNCTHWVQMSNYITACPIFVGDTRITVLHVPLLEKEIPKAVFRRTLELEAPFFLRTLLNLPLPTPTGRLRLPIVITDEKSAIIAGNMSVVEVFIDEKCERSPSYEMVYADFFEALTAEDGAMTKQKLSRELCAIEGITLRSGTGNKRMIHGIRMKGTK